MLPQAERISAGFLVSNKKVFIVQRKEDKSQPLKWELPRGKLKEDERYNVALIREFNEEFGIEIKLTDEIASVEVDLADKIVIIMFFVVEGDNSGIKLYAHKDSKYVSFEELKNLDLCDADKIFVEQYENVIKQYID